MSVCAIIKGGIAKMAFEKAFDNKYHELPTHTKYRFAELEIARAINLLTRLYRNNYLPRDSATRVIFDELAPKHMHTPEVESKFYEAFSPQFAAAHTKKELIQYLIVHGQSYTKIRNIAGVSFNRIANLRYGLPEYYPVFDRWEPEMLQKWNEMKHMFNLFDEELVHIKE
jgi:hypothetical protein